VELITKLRGESSHVSTDPNGLPQIWEQAQ